MRLAVRLAPTPRNVTVARTSAIRAAEHDASLAAPAQHCVRRAPGQRRRPARHAFIGDRLPVRLSTRAESAASERREVLGVPRGARQGRCCVCVCV